MDKGLIEAAIENNNIEWQLHALERMMERGILRSNVKDVLLSGKIIEEYPDDKPLPSALLLGSVNEQPLHVVTAYDAKSECCFIITAYKPDLEHFESDFKTRREHGD